MIQTVFDSPIGPLGIVMDAEAIVRIDFVPDAAIPVSTHPVLDAAKEQLMEYFAGSRKTFDLPLNSGGTAFQKRVWQALTQIPYGETETYGQLAARIDAPKAARAVGQANNRNPIPIVIPCHRVIGANGSLVGYSDGVDIKRRLLELEGVCCDRQKTT